MTVSLLDQIYNFNTAQTNTCVLPGGAPSTGDLIIAQGIRDTAGGNTFTGTGFTVPTVSTYAGRSIGIGYHVCTGGETDTFVLDWGNNGGNQMFVTRWGGSWGATPLDTDQGAAVGATATISVTPAAGESALIVGQIMNYQLNNCAPASGVTEMLDQANTGNVKFWAGYRIEATASGAYTIGGTLSGGGFQDGYIRGVSFIEGAPAGGGARSQVVIIG